MKLYLKKQIITLYCSITNSFTNRMIKSCNILVTLTNLIYTAEYTTDLGFFHPLFEETNNGKQYICLNGFSVIVVWIG